MTEIRITRNDAGQVSVTGPLEDKVLCYGLLALAHDIIAAQQPIQKRLVEPAAALPPEFRVKGD